MSRVFFKENVLEKARQRVKRIFDDFPRIVCTFSGGKDSLVVLNVALEEAEKRNRKIALAFLDQEAEWDSTIVEIKRWMKHPSIIPYWCRVPFILENATGSYSDTAHYLITYQPGKEKDWIHKYDSLAFHTFPEYITNAYEKMKVGASDHGLEICDGVRYPGFYLALDSLVHYASNGERTAVLGGMRASEALGRAMLCSHKFYGNMNATYFAPNLFNTEHVIIHCNPLYDWQGSDIWKYIYDKGLPYNTLYDKLYQYGMPHNKMRVSSVCHEMSLGYCSIFSEIEPDCWGRVLNRLMGVNAYKHIGVSYQCPAKFPSMFNSWKDYRDYLFETLIPEDKKPIMAKVLAKCNKYMGTATEEMAVKCQITSILICDLAGVKIGRFITNY